MNTIKGLVAKTAGLCGIARTVFLIFGALIFSLPFVTKSLLADFFVENMGFGIFGWFGLVPLFLTVFGFEKTLKRVFCSLFCFFCAFYFFVYSWFVNLYPLDFAGLGNGESVVVILCAVILIPLIHGVLMTLGVFAGYLSAKQTENMFLRALLVSFGYVMGEYFQSLGTFAFPWARLFVGQTENVYILQSASLFGSYFITLVMVLFNALLTLWLISFKDSRRGCRGFALAAAGIFLFNYAFGVLRVKLTDLSECESLDAVVLQGNIPSGEKWSGRVDEKEVYLQLADYALRYSMAKEYDADIAVMPETAFPVTLTPDDGFASSHEKTLCDISRMLDAELFAGAFNKEDGKSYNSIFLCDQNGVQSKPYNKYNIVPFGEYLPYRTVVEKLVPALAKMNVFSSDISRGCRFEPIQTKSGKAACLVCFDSIFSETARKQVKNGADFIVIATNDSWYKESAAIYQHADHAIMRAIENNVPVIRSANTGISRIIDSFGRVCEQTNVNEQTAISASVYLPPKRTLYTFVGDITVTAGFLVIVLSFVYGTLKKRKALRK